MVRKSNRLLISGALIAVWSVEGPAVENGETTFLVLGLILHGAVPTSLYLARLLLFSPRDLRALICGGDGVVEGEDGGCGGDCCGDDDEDDPAVLVVLLYALRPVNATGISRLLSTCRSSVVNGIYDGLFKSEDLTGLVDNVKEE